MMKKTIVTAICAAVTFCASALSINDSYYIGSFAPGTPADASSVEDYVNHLITLPSPGTDTALGQSFISNHGNLVPSSLPTAVWDAKFDSNPSTTIDITGYVYLTAKYGGGGQSGGGTAVWYVADLTGNVTIPASAFGSNGGVGLSGINLFNGNGSRLPDGGSTAMLIGLAFSGLAFLRSTRK